MDDPRLVVPPPPSLYPSLARSRGSLDLPREVIRSIALHLYDPLELTQQDRLTWGIFSTVDMHQERQDASAALIAFGMTCRRVRREVRVVQFRCIRTPTVQHLETVVANKDGWARYVKSIIIDSSMFDSDDDASADGRAPARMVQRSFWIESTKLFNSIQALPSLNHISFFADASDDATLASLFASLIPHPSSHDIPPPTLPPSPSVRSAASGYLPAQPSAARVHSFGWRQRAAPPQGTREFTQSSTFISTLHLLRHAHRLSFLVSDADLDEMFKQDISTACKELALRAPPFGEEAERVSLMLCGPIRGWNRQFLADSSENFTGIKESFIDRPLKKSMIAHETTFDAFTSLVEPLANSPHSQLLQVGSYIFSIPVQSSIAFRLAATMPSSLILGSSGDEGETNWWGIWRYASKRTPRVPEGTYDSDTDVMLVPLGDGHSRRLETEARAPAAF